MNIEKQASLLLVGTGIIAIAIAEYLKYNNTQFFKTAQIAQGQVISIGSTRGTRFSRKGLGSSRTILVISFYTADRKKYSIKMTGVEGKMYFKNDTVNVFYKKEDPYQAKLKGNKDDKFWIDIFKVASILGILTIIAGIKNFFFPKKR